MPKRKKTRFAVVGGVIVIVLLLAIAFVGAGTTSKDMTVTEAAQPSAVGKRVQVTGTVVTDSYSIDGNVLNFKISDPDDPSQVLGVSYDQGVSATFGNGVTAICKGTINNDGVLMCNDLVTKCPSKYETSTDALGVGRLLSYGDTIADKPVKISGQVKEGTLAAATSETRFELQDVSDPATTIPVEWTGALSEDISDGTSLVLTGSLNAEGRFIATDVSLDSEEA